MSMYGEAFDYLDQIEHQERLLGDFTTDQKLKIAEIKALLAISHELLLIQDQGINPEWRQR